MAAKDNFENLYRILETHNVYATNEFKQDILKLVKTDINKFVSDFYRYFSRENLKDYHKYERLVLTKRQNTQLDGHSLFRFEYRNTSNLRCIYMLQNENNIKETILLCAFKEDNSKKKGKDAYGTNIEKAISIYQKYKD